MKKMTMGLIVGNRGFFPDHLAKSGREEMLRALEQAGMHCIVLDPSQSKYGAVETHEEAKRCAADARRHDGREDHHVSLVALEPVNRVSEEVEVREACDQAFVAAHHLPYPVRLCSKRTDCTDAAAIALTDESFDLHDNRLSFRLVHRSATRWTNGFPPDVQPANSGFVRTRATQPVVVCRDPQAASVKRLVRELDDVRV